MPIRTRQRQALRHWSSFSGPAVLFVALTCAPRLARADVASCTTLHASGQREAKAGRLKRASEQYLTCASTDRCPEAIRSECVELYTEVQKVIPTVVFTVTDEQGHDITNVKVYSADQLVVESLTGRPVPLDPGKHHFRFALPSGEVLGSDVLVREGEKNRVVGVQVKDKTQAATRPATSRHPEPPAPAPAPTGQSLPAGFWVASGFAVASLASFGVFAVLGHKKQSALDECAPNCSPSSRADYDQMKRNYLIADVSLGVAAVSTGIATWLFFSAGPSAAPKRGDGRPPQFAVVPSVDHPGASLVVSGF